MGAAATASVTALCDENLYPKEIFDDQDFFVPNGLCSAASTTANHEIERFVFLFLLFVLWLIFFDIGDKFCL